MSDKSLPSQARAVIVGGGVMGCGLAYHLTHEGWSDVVLLEKAELTSGSTWHAAGQITHWTSSLNLGFNIELVGKERIAERHPFYNLDGVLGALHTPDDGHVDPSNVTMAMAAGTRKLGWELHMPMAHLAAVYQALVQAAKPLGLRDTGSFAMNALRMEKMFRGAGELTNEVTLPEAGVMRFARLDKNYIGAEATRASAAAAQKGQLPWICAYLGIEPDDIHDGHGGEAVLLEGQVVGSTVSVAYGHTVGKVLAFAYITPHVNIAGTEIEVVIAGTPRKGRILDAPAYDPESLKPRTDE